MRLKKRYLWPALLTAAGFLSWQLGYQAALKYFFKVSGTVMISGDLLQDLPGPNAMLFVIAKNGNGMPVAVSKIINPIFPARFRLTPSDLIMPDLLGRNVRLEALLSRDGRLEDFKSGDMKGARPEPSYFISKDQDITLTELGR